MKFIALQITHPDGVIEIPFNQGMIEAGVGIENGFFAVVISENPLQFPDFPDEPFFVVAM